MGEIADSDGPLAVEAFLGRNFGQPGAWITGP